MSDGAAVLAVPLAVVLIAPVVVFAAAGAAAGAAVLYTGKAAADMAHDAALAHQRSRVRVEQARNRALVQQARRLRVAHPDAPTPTGVTVQELARAAGQLHAANDSLAREVAEQQQQLNALESELAALRGRRATLERWRDEAGLTVTTESEPATDPTTTAVEEAEARVAAVAKANAALEDALGAAHRAQAAATTAAGWARLDSKPTMDPERDPQSASQRWRRDLRATLQRALDEAVLTEALPGAVATAWATIETTDEAAAERSVAAAIAEMIELVAHRATSRNFLAQLGDLTVAAQAVQGFAVLEACDTAREEFETTTRTWDATRLSGWAHERVHHLTDQVQRMKAARAQYRLEDEEAARALVASHTLDQLHDVLRELGHVSIPMETGRPSGGHLFVERAALDGVVPRFGRIVGLAADGTIVTIPVRLGRAASTPGERADDALWCDQQVDLDTAALFPELERRLRAIAPEGAELPERLIDVTHVRSGSLENRVLTAAQQQALAEHAAEATGQPAARTFDR